MAFEEYFVLAMAMLTYMSWGEAAPRRLRVAARWLAI